jgi:hypothetical protein
MGYELRSGEKSPNSSMVPLPKEREIFLFFASNPPP